MLRPSTMHASHAPVHITLLMGAVLGRLQECWTDCIGTGFRVWGLATSTAHCNSKPGMRCNCHLAQKASRTAPSSLGTLEHALISLNKR